ncbi:hypothetical protein SESBI_03771 [Sesbania bispinosa]|nr:hypothetical protein SESBI_03771 [Sesbania bispinosa]
MQKRKKFCAVHLRLLRFSSSILFLDYFVHPLSLDFVFSHCPLVLDNPLFSLSSLCFVLSSSLRSPASSATAESSEFCFCRGFSLLFSFCWVARDVVASAFEDSVLPFVF